MGRPVYLHDILITCIIARHFDILGWGEYLVEAIDFALIYPT